MKGGAIMKITMNFNDELLGRIDSYAKSNYLTRTSVMSIACNNFLLQHELQSLLKNMNMAFEKIIASGEVTEEQLKEFDQFKLLCDMVTKQGETD
jgi:metal-responsive CopG/Arc/MetJ family transcriptional regulator